MINNLNIVEFKYIVGGGAFVIDGKLLHTPYAKLHI